VPRRPMRLRTRLILSAAYLLVVILIALEIPLALSVQRRSVSEFGSVELGYAGLLSSQISDSVAQAAALTTESPHPGQSLTRVAGQVSAALPNVRILVIDVHRRVLFDSSREFTVGTVVDVSSRPELVGALRGEIRSEERYSTTLGDDLLLVAVPVHEAGDLVGAVRLSEPLGEVRNSVHAAWVGLAGVGLGALVVGLLVELLLANSLSRPVRRLEETARRLGAGELSARATPEGPREVHGLASSFNEMADALSANLAAQRDFVAYASHQLRTPLTGLKLRLEAIEQRRGDPVDQAAKAQVETDRLASLVADLLALASAASVEPSGRRVDLREPCANAVDRWSALAQRAGMDLTLRSDAAAWVWADPADVENVLDNLLDNAVRYCPAGTAITVEVQSADGRAALSVSDDGPGIPAQERARVFERFFRGTVGQRSGPGTGLGLAIVEQLVRRWGGEVRLADSHADLGTRIDVTFPRPPAQQ
jgi:two-component system, OmpR family, sensor kinase